jgi:hypothetical protein
MVSDANQYLDECAEAFLLSFSADVKTFLQPIIDKHWLARRCGGGPRLAPRRVLQKPA